jgi:hypothetical protein
MALYRLEWEQFLFIPLPLEEDDDFALVCGQAVQHKDIKTAKSPFLLSLETQKHAKISATADSELHSIDSSSSLGSELLVATGDLISHRKQHVVDIQSGNLRSIKNMLAESVARQHRAEQLIIKHEAGHTTNGYGISVSSDGTLYAGDFLGGDRDGTGVLRWSNGHTYFGQWRGNVAQGRGRYRFPNGDTYTGEWDSGCEMQGGVFMHDDGEEFDGENRMAQYLASLLSSATDCCLGTLLQKLIQKTSKTSELTE